MVYKKRFPILVVDDETEYQNVLSLILDAHGYSVCTASSGEEALKRLSENDFKLMLTDLKMPGMSGMELIKKAKEMDGNIEIIVVTAFGTIESAVEAIKHGASSYFVKSDDPEALLIDVDRIAQISSLVAENNILKQQAVSPDLFMETKNEKFAHILQTCRKAADSNINIMILGESGVGKEVVAHYIHQIGDRRDNHFIPVNCQSFSDGTIESELFGHEKGAFTGAINLRIGRFEEANYGTIFLDEIGDLPMQTQGKLLRTLENRTIERMGSNKSIHLDIRLISATNKDLEKMAAAGKFRQDLMYRINTLAITIPPLRERREDIPGLVEFFMSRIQVEQKKKITEISKDVMEFLLTYDYPGNVRELKNILERLVVLSDDGVISGNGSGKRIKIEDIAAICSEKEMGLKEARAVFEKHYIQEALKKAGNNVNKAAEILNITSRQLWNKISEYDLRREK